MKRPLVSVITPCFNSEQYIERYLNSMLNQSYDNVQLIIVNDGSSDATENIVLRFKEKVEAKGYILTYFKQENRGLGGAINSGLKLVQGDYFSWCDSDNFYSSDYFEKKIEYFQNHKECAVVRCDGYIVDESNISEPIGRLAKENEFLYCDSAFLNCLMVNHFHFGCAMIKTAAFDKVNPNREIYPSRAGQNWQLLLPVLYSFQSGYIDEALFYFVHRKESLSNITQYLKLEDKIGKQNEYVKILINTLDSIEMDNEEREKYKEMVLVKYAKYRMYIYLYANNKAGVLEEFAFLRKNHKLDLKTVFATSRSFFPFINNIIIKRHG